MAIQYVGGNTGVWVGSTGTNNTVSLTTLTGGIAAAAAIGDIVIAVYSTGSVADRVLTINTGYTLIATELYSNGSTADTNLRVAYKVLTAADTTVTFGPTGSTADAGAAAVYVFRGVAGIVLDVPATTATGTGTGRPTPPAITPIDTGSVIVCVGAGAAGAGAVYTTATLTSFRTVTSPDTNDAMLGIGYFAWTSGTYTPAQFGGGTVGGGDSWAAMSIALQAAQTYTANVTETVTASDTESALKTQTLYITESNADLGNIIGTTAMTAGSGGGLIITATISEAATFVAPYTGQLGNLKACINSQLGTTPTTQGAIELWQLASNSITAFPTTLLTSFPISYRTLPTATGINTIEFDLSNVSGMSVTAGTGYAIVFAGGSDWDVGGTNSWGIYYSANPDGIATTQTFTRVSGTWFKNTTPVTAFGIELDYLSDTITTQTGSLPLTPAVITESVTATDEETVISSYKVYDLESNASLGSAMNGVAYNISSASSFNITSTRKGGSTFIAPVTGQLGNIKASMASSVFGTTPTANGAIELWQLASNSLTAIPTTLLATLAIPFRTLTYINSQQVNIEYDLSIISGMTVTAGTGYAIVFAGGTDWGASTALWQLPYANAGASLYGAVDSIGGTWSTPTAARGASIELDYTNATLDSEVAGLALISDITETGTATETEDAAYTTSSDITETGTATETENAINLLGAAITETGTATEAETAVDQANAWIWENTVGGPFANGIIGNTTTGAYSGANASFGIRFIANQTAQLGIVTIQTSYVGSVPTVQPARVTLWQLASNSLTALPSINLGEITFDLTTTLTNISTPTNFDFTSLNITLTSGVGYAVTITNPSDSSPSTSYLIYARVENTVPPANAYNYYRALYSNTSGTYPSTYSTNAFAYKFNVQPVQATAATQIGGFVASSAITETVTSTETEDAGIAFNVVDTETVTATETESATYNPTALITETVTSTETETAVNTANALITETGTANGTQTAINLATAAITESAPATETETAIYNPNADITESAPATDTETGGFIATSAITETVTSTETETAQTSKDVVITETSPATETEIATYTTNSDITESAPATEEQLGGFTAVSDITESVTGTEYQISALITPVDITESVIATNTQDSILQYNSFITEVADAVVTSVVYANFVVSITETVNATDLYFARGWFIIPDGQTPGWNPINDSQTVLWTAVDDAQTSIWNIVNTAQTVTWTAVNDGQIPNWVDVDDNQ